MDRNLYIFKFINPNAIISKAFPFITHDSCFAIRRNCPSYRFTAPLNQVNKT